MININEYIIEKLKLNSDSKLKTNEKYEYIYLKQYLGNGEIERYISSDIDVILKRFSAAPGYLDFFRMPLDVFNDLNANSFLNEFSLMYKSIDNSKKQKVKDKYNDYLKAYSIENITDQIIELYNKNKKK